jgi:hypothetical protein
MSKLAAESPSIISKIGKCFGQIPLLKGKGAAKRRVRGKEIVDLYPSPGSLARATLSLQERDCSSI